MHSGAIAGESIVESFARNRDANAVYDELIQSERTRTVDQWAAQILFDNPHEADLKGPSRKFPPRTAYMVKEARIRPVCGYHWVAPILSAAARQLFSAVIDNRWCAVHNLIRQALSSA